MALSVKTNQLTGPASTGDSATTDPGFQPKGLIIFKGLQTAAGGAQDAQWSLGVASSSTTERGAGWNSDDNTASSDVVRYFSTTEIVRNLTAGTTTANITATLTSFDATGFTPNWGTLTTTSPKFNYFAFGGTDITNVTTGSFAASASTGNQAVTGLGYKPDIVIFFITLQTAAGQSNNNSQYSMGVMHSSGQWAIGGKAQNAQATMNTARFFQNNRCIAVQATVSTALIWEASYVSMDSDGFTINIDVTDGSLFLIGYMAIKGGQWKVGTETQKTSTGTKATTGVGFLPSALMFGSVCDTQTAGVNDHNRQVFGVTTGTGNNTCLFAGDSDNTANAVASTIMSATKCIVMATEAGASPTTQAECALSSFDSDGFTLNWSTADATARVFGYIALGANSTGSSIKTFDGLAYASTKTVNGLARASVKTWEGLA